MRTAQVIPEGLQLFEAKGTVGEQTLMGVGRGRMADDQVVEQPVQLKKQLQLEW